MKLFDSELKVMDVLWTNGDMPARQIAAILTESIGWNVNTTYTLIKRCIAKNAIEYIFFICKKLSPIIAAGLPSPPHFLLFKAHWLHDILF